MDQPCDTHLAGKIAFLKEMGLIFTHVDNFVCAAIFSFRTRATAGWARNESRSASDPAFSAI
jgi:hypothetical protein